MRRYTVTGRLRRAIAAAAGITLVAIACGGCAYIVPTTSLERESQDRWFAKDLPVPEGFVLRKHESRIHDRGHRTLRLTYRRESYIDIDRAWDFYKQAMAARGWDLRYLYGMDRRGMIFWKGDEELRITLERSLGSAWVTAVLEVEPKEPTGATVLARRVQ